MSRFPSHGVRVESGVETGSVVTPYYDSMLAKLIARGKTRDAALDRLDAALGETSIFGITTNQGFLRRLIALPATRNADFHTRLIDDRLGRDWSPRRRRHRGVRIGGVPLADGQARGRLRQPVALARDDRLAHGGWRRGSFADPDPAPRGAGGDRGDPLLAAAADSTMLIAVNEQLVTVGLERLGGEDYLAILSGREETVRLQQDGEKLYVHGCWGTHAFRAIPYLTYMSAAAERSGELRAPMMGMITRVNVAAGDAVKAGDVVAVMELMKMELRIASKMDGLVATVNCKTGDMVERNAVVAVVEQGR